MKQFRMIPSIEKLLQSKTVRLLEERFGYDVVVHALREETELMRINLENKTVNENNRRAITHRIEEGLAKRLHEILSPSLRPVINATGTIIHTNLGRAPLAFPAIKKIESVAGYSNLEFDLELGKRGSRNIHTVKLLQRLTGAEDGTVVNNNAAAVLLTLTALAAGKEVIISRGELVEIGGGFRIPDVLRQAGAHLREVGTTNRTRSADYASAINNQTAIILRINPSNFRIEGFTERPSLNEIIDIGQRFKIPVVEDLGSGNVVNQQSLSTSKKQKWEEPTVNSSVTAGVTVCCFSGDKLLGGPQAGIIIGKHTEVEKIRHHPLMRALRVDKIIYAALEATLLEHVTGRANRTIPVITMISESIESLQSRAQKIVKALAKTKSLALTIELNQSVIGGGTTPGVQIPSCIIKVQLDGCSPDKLEMLFRKTTPPIIGRIHKDCVLLDLRTVQPSEDSDLTNALKELTSIYVE